MLFGSRARGDARPRSDWDLGFIADGAGERFDADDFLARLVSFLGSENVDLVDLRRAGALLRFRAARDGLPLHEAKPDAFARFRLDAVSFFCDAEPVRRRAWDARLARLPGGASIARWSPRRRPR